MIALPQPVRNLLVLMAFVAICAGSASCQAQGVLNALPPKKAQKVRPEFSFDLSLPKGTTVATLTISVKIPKNEKGKPYHIFSMRSRKDLNTGKATKVIFEENSPWQPVDAEFTADRAATPHTDKLPDGDIHSEFYEGPVKWTRRLRLKAGAENQTPELKGVVKYQMCDEQKCFLGLKQDFNVPVKLVDRVAGVGPDEAAPPLLQGPDVAKPLEANLPPVLPEEVGGAGDQPPVAQVAGIAGDKREVAAVEVKPRGKGINKADGLPWFLLTAVLAGFAALLTPCVFPMVPITISFFNKQAEKEHHRPITMASVYCLGIIGTFTVLGLVMSILFGAASLNQVANSPWLNIFLALVLVFFGLSLLGMYEIRMPSWLLTATSGQQSRGGYLGVLFMALTFTLTSFTCTFAFAGGLLVAAAQGDRLWPVLGLLAFSAAFALPFFFLALFPSLLQKLPRSGGWMNVIKVVMGMVEIGAAFKFLSVADLGWNPVPWLFNYELVLASWMVISLTTGAYLLGMFRLPHDVETTSIGVSRLLSAMGFIGLAVYMAIGLFATQKPTGALWENIVAFAPPKFEHPVEQQGGEKAPEKRPEGPFIVHGGLSYSLDVQKAVEFAVRENLPLFVEFTGVNCVNCRKMENGPMNRPDAKDRLARFVRVQLYTDNVPNIERKEADRLAEFNRRLQEDWFGDATLPAYGIVSADPHVLKNPNAFLNDQFKGLEQSRGEFTKFLDDGLSRWQALQGQKKKELAAEQASKLNTARAPEGPSLNIDGLHYALDAQKALEFAVREKRPLLVEFTGVNHIGCAKVNKVLARPDVAKRLNHFVRVQLFLDFLPTITDKQQASKLLETNRKLQEEWFGDVTLPAFVIVCPTANAFQKKYDQSMLADFYGSESPNGDFEKFLDSGLEKWQKRQPCGCLVGAR